MFNPVSTYRIQFHKDFTFKHLEEIIPYLQQLGVKTLYASPIFEATPGSTHGYDIVDPLNINPEIGTLEELRKISAQLKELNISWLQDIVPNHMAFHPRNKWLMDVLEKGRQSEYASFFDIDWNNACCNGRLMVPFLGVPFKEAIAQKQIQLVKKSGKLWFDYFGQQYPVNAAALELFTPAYLKKVNADPDLLKEIADHQAYQLCYWQDTDKVINFRRFFTVNGLICLNMHDDHVFSRYHQLIKQLVDEGIFQGIRVDHIDGLYDPPAYLKQLREHCGPDIYITIEKILEEGEELPLNWPVQGNTGYDFLAMVNNVFTEMENKQLFTDNYQKITGDQTAIQQQILQKKAYILRQHMGGELSNLLMLFKNLQLAPTANIPDDQLKEAIAQFLIHCPVYRFYGNSMPLATEESAAVAVIIDTAAKANPDSEPALQMLKSVLLESTLNADDNYNQKVLRFYQRCMQFTGPLMAKGVEDTLMYTYNRFIGHNEVGDSPSSFGYPAIDFHELMTKRQHNWPQTINATSTHDTKRGEDVRARLNVLSDLPDEWFELLKQWKNENGGLLANRVPDDNDAYFIYQTIIGAYPMPGNDDNFLQRLQEYLEKALREGKQNSDWAEPVKQYEDAVKNFLAALLKPGSQFLKSFASFHQRIADFGIVNSLAQVLLKFSCPGVPDTYQGRELWDLSLVDPDNRRPVDYQLRNRLLKNEQAIYNEDFWQSLWQERYNGQVKLCLTQRLLQLRDKCSKLFNEGEYIPLNTSGKYKNNVLAFARQYASEWYITIIPLHLAALGADAANPIEFNWKDTAVILPEEAPRSWKNVLTDSRGFAAGTLPVSEVFKGLPLALIKLDYPENRGAGLLVHITSLPSAFGSGDIGPEAYKFVDFLFSSRQRYWQMLPVNPVDKGAAYSPYSANSSIAGNTLLISPELLVNDGWLNKSDLQTTNLPSTNYADFDTTASIKSKLFDLAYERFKASKNAAQQEFLEFKATEAYWLDDFALYKLYKQLYKNQPWYKWPGKIKKRNISELQKASKQYQEIIGKEKWLQYIFSKQWQQLRVYAKKRGVTLFGDMPFYISYDSVDVWSQPELFKLDEQGAINGIAGVPPDYFSAEGQLWGMPVYNWDVLSKTDYKWWVQRINKNLEYFDLIRLDHFRAFAAYWEVPGGEQTAINGTWVPGPGSEFFRKIEKALGNLPFVAEDLGDIDASVHQLRDEFALPGMRVLQFAFGQDTPQSDHIPHSYTINSFAYTGTHDNNTLKGWFQQDTNAASRKIINRYLGMKLADKNVCQALIRLCYASVAKVAILPVQDILELDADHRMNMPASVNGNWTWRLVHGQLNKNVAIQLRDLATLYNR